MAWYLAQHRDNFIFTFTFTVDHSIRFHWNFWRRNMWANRM